MHVKILRNSQFEIENRIVLPKRALLRCSQKTDYCKKYILFNQ